MLRFFSNDVPQLKNKRAYAKWIIESAELYQKRIGELNFIFCSNQYLLEINKSFLNHDFYTDVITFDNSTSENLIEGEVYISYERVREFALENNIPFALELARVIAHGVLHLIGYKDKSKQQKSQIREEEDKWIERLANYVPRGTQQKSR